jgi:hypothetical protein
VVNLVGDGYPTPAIFRPLLTMVAARHAKATYFLQFIPKHLTDQHDRDETEAEIRRAEIGYRLWAEQRGALVAWAGEDEEAPLAENDVDDWWFSGERRQLVIAEYKRVDAFLEAAHLTDDEAAFVRADLWEDGRPDRLLIYRLRRDLHWLDDLDTLRDLAAKTWPAEPAARRRWTEGELAFVDRYYGDQEPELIYDGDPAEGIDPFGLRPVFHEQSLGFGLDGLAYCMEVVMRAVVIDFVDEILDHTRFPKARGSIRCVECGRFVGRRALGYGQLYCGETCKKRAAKRRYRARPRASALGA